MTANQKHLLDEFSAHSYNSKYEAPVKCKSPERHMYYASSIGHGMFYSLGQDLSDREKGGGYIAS